MENLTQIYGYLHGMWRYRWSALLVAWIVAVTGWLVVFAIPDKFEAKAVVFIDTDSIMKPLLKGLTVQTPDSLSDLDVTSRVLLSRENLLAVIHDTDMDLEVRTPEDRDRLVTSLASSIQLSGWDENQNQRNKREPKSNIYEISYQGDSAQLAQQIVSKLLNTLIDKTLNSSRTDTAAAQKFLEKQIADYGQQLTVTEQRLAEFKKANAGLLPDDSGGYYARLQRSEDALAQTQLALKLAEKRKSELLKQLSSEKPLIDSASYQSASMVTLRQYQAKLENLLTQYTEDYPEVKELRSRIANIKSGNGSDASTADAAGSGNSVEFNPVYQDLKTELSKTSVEVETLKTQLADQEKGATNLRKSINAIPQAEASLAKLNRDYEVTRKRYLELVGSRDSARLTQDAGRSGDQVTFRIIDPPVVPTLPSAPNRLLLLFGVLLVSLAAGLGWSLLRFQMLPTFISLKQLRHSMALPVLGSVNLSLTPAHRLKRGLQLTSFLVAGFLLIGAFGGVVWYRDAGTTLVGSVFSAGKALVGSVFS